VGVSLLTAAAPEENASRFSDLQAIGAE